MEQEQSPQYPLLLEHEGLEGSPLLGEDESATLNNTTQELASVYHNEVRRDLKERHISIFAITGMMGTGIYLTSGRSLADAGPAGALLGYALVRFLNASDEPTIHMTCQRWDW